MTLRRVGTVLLLVVAVASITVVFPSVAAATTSYSAGTPSADGVLDGPWNTSQGDPSEGSAYQLSDLFPTYTPGGNTTALGGVSEPNLAVYPAASGSAPYPSGVAGTPGPLDGYCSSLGPNPESGPAANEPSNTDLPFAPYYFPDVVRNGDGSLTGYFDWRPKDADEAITVARSTDNGATWSTEGEALEQNPSYCPTADTNDDGEGHPFATTVNGSNTLYTLQRGAGDYPGVGLLVHSIGADSSSDPLSGLPASEVSGIDPNTFATASTPLSATATSIPVTTLGSAGTANQIVAGPYVDYSHNPATSGSAPTVITCTGTTTSPSNELTGCTVSSGASFTVGSGDALVQVMEDANPGSGKTYTVPASSAQVPAGTGGLSKIAFSVNTYGYANATSNSNALAWLLNNNAPNRVYIDGHAVYCNTTNTNPITTNLQDCTSPTGPFTVNNGDAITGDPISPSSARTTTGLVAPDGIVGTVPYTSTFNGQSVPGNATIMLYTEKIANYFLEGELNGGLNAAGTTYTAGNFTLPGGSTTFGLNYQPYPGTSEPLPASGSFSIYTVQTVGSTNSFVTVTCTGWNTTPASNAPPNSINVTGCTSSGTGKIIGTGSTNSAIGSGQGDWIGGPNAAVVPYSVLAKIGEGSNGSKSAFRLFGNNEDYTVLRAADTTDGVNFTDLGAVSGTSSGTGNNSGSYSDIANPLQQYSPQSSASPTTATLNPTSPTNLTSGSSDAIELRYVGSRGTIITNPDGSLGMFLSGSWASDGDSDAFNQIFYTTSSDGGQTWSVPSVVFTTDYTFAASVAQASALNAGIDSPLGVSAYYSGRAYGPAVVQNPNGTLTLVFAGYRLPKPITSDGAVLGTNASDQYTLGATDPALYRNILTATLQSSTSPAVPTSSTLSVTSAISNFGTSQTLTDTVAVNSPGAGIPTGTVNFFANGDPISQCQNVALSDSAPDQASCTTSPLPAGSDAVSAVYSGDSNYAASTATATATVVGPPTASIASPGGGVYNLGQSVPTSFSCSEAANGPGIASCQDSNGASGGTGALSTSTPGTFVYTVTATSNDGQSATALIIYTVIGAPSVSIASPARGGVYNVGQSVPTSFSCSEATNGPGIALCADNNEGSGTSGTLNTSAPGTFTYTVTATSLDGQTATASISYTVVGPPSVSIHSPSNRGVYNLGQNVPTSFSCSEATNGPGITSCQDSNGASGGTGALNTSVPGSFTYTVTATSSDGQTGAASITYTVVGPPSTSIASPASGAVVNVGQSAPTSFSCTEAPNGPGIASCADSNSGSGTTGQLNTSQVGTFTYSVTATSRDGQTATASINYTVVGPPTASIAAPANRGVYDLGQSVSTSFSCSEATNGPGVASCQDSNGASGGSGSLNTSAPGSFTYTVTATSEDGQTGTTSISYIVLPASSPVPVGGGCNAADGKVEGYGATSQQNAQALFWNNYGPDICGEVTRDPVAGQNMGAYNWAGTPNADIGSTAGLVGADCRSADYWGTDLPYTQAEYSALGETPGTGASSTGVLGQSCPTLFTTFPPDANTDPSGVPDSRDAAAQPLSFPIAGTSEAILINLTAADCGGSKPSGVELTGPQLSLLFGGTITNWNDSRLRTGGLNSSLANCNETITRVVRSDTAGSTNVLKQYLNNVTSDGTTCAGLPWTSYLGGSVNNTWPQGGSSCGADTINAGANGGQAQLQLLQNTNGGIGYAALSDAATDTTGLITAGVQNAVGTSFQPPQVGTGANCSFSGISIPGYGVADALVGLDATDNWSVDNETANGQPNHWDATDQGSQYPICGLSFAIVYPLSLDPRSVSTVSVDQARTLYTFFRYVESIGQSLLPGSHYAALPPSMTSPILEGLQVDY